MFLGGIPHGCKISYHKPGAVHRARWRAGAIYALKIWIFKPLFAQYQKQRQSTSHAVKATVLQKLDEFCVFIVSYYIRARFSAVSPANAPRNVLDLYKGLVKETNKAIREAGLKALGCHMWYLSEVTVGLVLFDDELSLDEKQNFVANLKSEEESEEPRPRICVKETYLENKTVASFVTKNTKKFPDLLEINKGFLDVDPALWGTNPPY